MLPRNPGLLCARANARRSAGSHQQPTGAKVELPNMSRRKQAKVELPNMSRRKAFSYRYRKTLCSQEDSRKSSESPSCGQPVATDKLKLLASRSSLLRACPDGRVFGGADLKTCLTGPMLEHRPVLLPNMRGNRCRQRPRPPTPGGLPPSAAASFCSSCRCRCSAPRSPSPGCCPTSSSFISSSWSSRWPTWVSPAPGPGFSRAGGGRSPPTSSAGRCTAWHCRCWRSWAPTSGWPPNRRPV